MAKEEEMIVWADLSLHGLSRPSRSLIRHLEGVSATAHSGQMQTHHSLLISSTLH